MVNYTFTKFLFSVNQGKWKKSHYYLHLCFIKTEFWAFNADNAWHTKDKPVIATISEKLFLNWNNFMLLKNRWQVRGVGRRRTQLLDDLRNRRRYWELNENAEDRKMWNRQFINRTLERNSSHLTEVNGSANKQPTFK